MKNEGNVAVKLSLIAQNWNPTNAPNYMGLSWNREGLIVNSGTVITATLTLSVSSSISGITSFSFDIVITGTEQ
jgi:type IV secretory pathway VirB10-like protein